MNSFEQQVRERAYYIWISAGMAEGMAHEHWTSAEQAVMSEQARPIKAAAKTKQAAGKTIVAATSKSASARKSPVKTPLIPVKVAKRKAGGLGEPANSMSVN